MILNLMLKRFMQFIPVLLLASIAVWGMTYALPGDPAIVLAGIGATSGQVEALRHHMGLDQPVWDQYLIWAKHVLSGDLGHSFDTGQPVSRLLLDRLPATAQLAVCSMIVGLTLAVVTGVTTAIRPNGWAARICRIYRDVGIAIPTFWLGLLLILLFAVKWHLLPATSDYIPIWQHPVDGIKAIALPAITLGVHVSAITSRFIDAALREAMSADHVRTARSKGVSEPMVVTHHGLRNAMVPVVTVVGIQLAHFLGGTVVTEVVFNYPGAGRLIFSAIGDRDYAVVQGGVLFVVLIFLLINLAVDILYAVLDPRISVQ
jgi:peptide/nickel transport system permease protein